MYDGGRQTSEEAALRTLLGRLKASGYSFITPTPSTVTLVRNRRDASDEDLLRDVFGWTRKFRATQLDASLLDALQSAGLVEAEGGTLRSRIRVSTCDGRLFVHTAPTNDADAVFLGPDSYRYARLLRTALEGVRFNTALDLGAGAGVGALTLNALDPSAAVVASDVNPKALRYVRLNAEAADLSIEVKLCDGIPQPPTAFDVIAANPPYVAGDGGRVYRDGGGQLGAALALDWLRTGLPRLSKGGRFVLYTGSAIVAGQDFIHDQCRRLAEVNGCSLNYAEIDPDVFGSTLRQSAYSAVERIAAIGAVFTADS